MKRFLLAAFLVSFTLIGCKCGDDPLGQVEFKLEVTPKELDFGPTKIGASEDKMITIKNVGMKDGKITTPKLKNNDKRFTIDPISQTIKAGTTVYLRVIFTPDDLSKVQDTLVIESENGDQRFEIALCGNCKIPDIEVCYIGDDGEVCNVPGEVLKATIMVSDVGDEGSLDFYVKNSKDATLDLNVNEFSRSEGTSSELTMNPEPFPQSVIAPGDSKSFQIRFKPVDYNFEKTTLRIESNDPDEYLVEVVVEGRLHIPKACIDPIPPTIDFGEVEIGSTKTMQMKITNCGEEPLEVSRFELQDSTGEFGIPSPPSIPVTLQPGEELTTELTYSPSDLGVDEARLYLTTNDPESSNGWLTLRGEGILGPSCDLDVQPRVVNFGAVAFGRSKSKTIYLVNVGTEPCEDVTVSDPDPDPDNEFAISGLPGPVTINPGVSYQVTATYSPNQNGASPSSPDSSSIHVTSNDPLEPDIEVVLQGSPIDVGNTCYLEADTAPVDFGLVALGNTVMKRVTFTNYGGDDCEIPKIQFSDSSDPDYFFTDPGQLPSNFNTITVSPGSSFFLDISFRPQNVGTRDAQLEIYEGNPVFSSLNTVVDITGKGKGPKICVSPQQVDFGAVLVGSTATDNLLVINCGTDNLVVNSYDFSNGSSPPFGFATIPQSPVTLTPGDSVTVELSFAPQDYIEYEGWLKITSSDPTQGTTMVKLTGKGAAQCGLRCAPNALTFYNIYAGSSSTKRTICENIGLDAKRIDSIDLAPNSSTEFTLNFDSLPVTLQTGDSFIIDVTYAPADQGQDSGKVVVKSSGCGDETDEITLNASAISATTNIPECITPQTFNPMVEWIWNQNSTSVLPDYNQVWMTPIVAQMTDDNGDGAIDHNDIPDVIFSTCKSVNVSSTDAATPIPAVIRVVSGDDGHEHYTINLLPDMAINSENQLAVADIDGDNRPEIIAEKLVDNPGTGPMGMQGHYVSGNLLAFENDGTLKWESDPWTRPQTEIEDASAMSIADLDGDGKPEIILGDHVYRNDGTLWWKGDDPQRANTGHGAMSTVADLDLDGRPEVIVGARAYRYNGVLYWDASEVPNGGMPMVVDLDGNDDPYPEVVVNIGKEDGSEIWVLEHDGTLRQGPIRVNTTDDTILVVEMAAGDLDCDGQAEIVVPAEDKLVAYDSDLTVMWEANISDMTGSAVPSVFDFEGDGCYDVVFADEGTVYIFRGTDGTKIYEKGRPSVTGWEIPVVADVDGDNRAEIVVAVNSRTSPGGIMVLGNSDNNWVKARKIWNQHDYHITNIEENGTVPRHEVPHWQKYNIVRGQNAECNSF